MQRFSVCMVAAAAIAGCAGHPEQPAAANPHQVAVDASNVADVQAAGYTIVNKNGEKLYCRKDPVTGSRVEFQTTCLTAQELYDRQHETQNAMSLITNQQTPVGNGK
jgi:hypothetical protein